MNREFLKGLGLNDEQIESTMKEHGKTVQAAKPTDYEDLKSAKATLESQIEQLNNTLQAKNDEYTQQESTLGDLQKQVKGYEVNNLKTRIASQAGLPLDFAIKLSGETEDELKADADKFSSYFKPKPLPLKGTEPEEVGKDNDEDLREMVQKLNGMGD